MGWVGMIAQAAPSGRSLGREPKAGVSVGLPLDVVAALNAYCRERAVTRSAAIEVAVRRFLLSEKGRPK